MTDPSAPPTPAQTIAHRPKAHGSGTKCGFVSLIGAPNSGKSTLNNALTGAKISIVTHKVQTTRSRIRGICMTGASQIILVDTPGIFAPRRRLDRAMVRAAWAGAHDADLVCVLVDAAKGADGKPDRETLAIFKELPKLSQPIWLILNKTDRVEKHTLLALTSACHEAFAFQETFMISALTGDGVSELKAALAAAIPDGPWLFEPDRIVDAPAAFLAAEITREKLMLRVHQEIPYAVTVETTSLKHLKKNRLRIDQTIFVERTPHKKIVIGAKGQTIKQISMAARAEIADLLGQPVDLFLFVKIRRNWSDDPERYQQLQLDYPD